MYWWYKDVFVVRTVYSDRENYNHGEFSAEVPKLSSFTKLKTEIVNMANIINSRFKFMQSAQIMKKLSDQQLRDIGLSQGELYRMSLGLSPVRFQENAVESRYPRKSHMALVCDNSVVNHSDKEKSTHDYQKAA